MTRSDRMHQQMTSLLFTNHKLQEYLRKKMMKLDELKKLESEKIAFEKVMNDKETEYARTRGGKYMKRDDFKQYAANFRGKNA